MSRLPWTGRGRVGIARLVSALAVAITLESVSQAGDSAPPYPTYRHKSVVRKEHGTGARSYWLFEPAEPTPASAPVVVFNHGWLDVNPGVYGAWIEHLARSGRVVIFPRYQANALTDPKDFLPNTLAAVADALDVLDTARGHVRPDRNRFAVIGHSAGGNLAVQIAALAADAHLPRLKAVIAMMPGEVQPMREPSLAKVPAETLLVVAVAEDDVVVGDARGRQIFSQTTAIPASRKKFVLYRTDTHGNPKLVAHHLSPAAALPEFDGGDSVLWRGLQMRKAEVNAFDKAGFWRMADITMEAAFAGRTLDEATRKGELFRNLGYWSDGRPVTPPIVGNDLAQIPRVFPNNGVRLIDWSPELGFPPPNLIPIPAATSETPALSPLRFASDRDDPARRR